MKTYKEVIDALDDESKKVVQGEVDRRVNGAIKTVKSNVSILPNALQRLAAIETAAENKIKKLEMQKLTLKKCYEKGVDYETISALGLEFTDEAELDRKLNFFIKDAEKQKNLSLQELLANSTKPGAGVTVEKHDHFGIQDDIWNKLRADEQVEVANQFNRRKK